MARERAECPETAAKRFVLLPDGSWAGGEEEGKRLVEAMRRQHVVLVRVEGEEPRRQLQALSKAAHDLLSGNGGVEGRQSRFGFMRDMQEGQEEGSTAFSVVGYAGGATTVETSS